eukprot:1147496-Pleurochrysis_carterae.AAC.1
MYLQRINANYSRPTYSSTAQRRSSEPAATLAQNIFWSIPPTEATSRRRYSCTHATHRFGSCHPSRNSMLATPAHPSRSRFVRWGLKRKNTQPFFARPAFSLP